MSARLGTWCMRAVVAFGFALLYVPFLVILLLSFNDSPAPTLPFKGFTLHWYSELLHDDALRTALGNTMKIGLAATIVSTAFGTLIAVGLRHADFRGRGLYELLLSLPFLLPEVTVGVATVTALDAAGVTLSLTTILIAHVLVTLVVAERTIAVRLSQIPLSWEEASRDLGRSPVATFFLVVLPNLRSALLSAGLLTFTVSFDQTIITSLVAGNQTTLPTFVFAQVRRGFTPELNSIAALFLVVSSALGVLLWLNMSRGAATASAPDEATA
jgi:spermidine/putrescine transport system permease protein